MPAWRAALLEALSRRQRDWGHGNAAALQAMRDEKQRCWGPSRPVQPTLVTRDNDSALVMYVAGYRTHINGAP